MNSINLNLPRGTTNFQGETQRRGGGMARLCKYVYVLNRVFVLIKNTFLGLHTHAVHVIIDHHHISVELDN